MFTDDLTARIEGRLAELAVEAERLTAARQQLVSTATTPQPPPRPRPPGRTTGRRGHTLELVLNSLDPEEPHTAGDVAKATGVSRSVAGATLSRLLKQGQASKAKRGYLRAA